MNHKSWLLIECADRIGELSVRARLLNGHKVVFRSCSLAFLKQLLNVNLNVSFHFVSFSLVSFR